MSIIAGIGLLMALIGFLAVIALYAASDRPGARYGYKISPMTFALPWKMAWCGVSILAIEKAMAHVM